MDTSELFDVSEKFTVLRERLSCLPNGPILVSAEMSSHLQALLSGWPSNISSAPPGPQSPTLLRTDMIVVEENVKITKYTTLSKLYRYPPGMTVEYPETSTDSSRPVGHLFHINPDDFYLPWRDFSYSNGAPDGGLRPGETVTIPLLVDGAKRVVPCLQRHATCQGMKACPLADLTELQTEHIHATRDAIREQLATARDMRHDWDSPKRDIFLKTFAFISAVRSHGCKASVDLSHRSPEEQEEIWEQLDAEASEFHRGYTAPETCDGEIVFHDIPGKKPYLSCEHYVARTNSRHFVDYTIANGQYNLDYITAVFTGDEGEISRIEAAAEAQDYGPSATCQTVLNFSNQRSHCSVEHRENGTLVRKQLMHLACTVKFRIWYPEEEFRHTCPFVLVTSAGAHAHPIPLPERTPVPIQKELTSLMQNIKEDLADLTPRRFIGHPAVKAFLHTKFPDISQPMLSDLHPSLANRSHLGSYIDRVRKLRFPNGTDWAGVLYLKSLQDADFDLEHRYIRTTLEIENCTLAQHDEDEPAELDDTKTRIIVCMSPEGSRRLCKAAYIQSDIAFQRIVGFKEFEMASMDRDANTSVIFCRVYLNRQSAAAHEIVFNEIERIVLEDTGAGLQWRHIDGLSVDDFNGKILHWGADQHRGQAKGLGLHLVGVAASRSGDRMDLHEPHRSLRSLDPYDHLRRIFRLCAVHFFRNIKTSTVPEHVRNLMRSLSCVSHPNWDETIERIVEEGGKTGLDWIRDKESSKFAFPGLCQEKSFVPLDIWKAGEPNSNLIETVHRDANREGVHCTLVGGLLRGQRFDSFKVATLKEWEFHGIRPTYRPVDISVNSLKNLKRQQKGHWRQISAKEAQVAKHNDAIRKVHEELENVLQQQEALLRADRVNRINSFASNPALHELQKQLAITRKKVERLQARYKQQVSVGRGLREMHAIGVLLPA